MSEEGFNKDSILEAAEEAKTAPTKFLAKERSTYVEDRIREVMRLREVGKNADEIRELMSRFAEDYPTLFLKACEPGFDQAQLRVMLSLLNRMGDGSLTQHQASMIVGQRLVDRYVKGKVPGSSSSSGSR